MANTAVWHAKYQIDLDLTDLPHLGHPGRPGLLDELYPDGERGVLQCPDCRDMGDAECPEWMYLRQRAGRLHAVHFNKKIGDHAAQESDAHKALKERIATAGENGGLRADVESRALDGSRRTDVRITGGTRDLACEAQLSYASRANVQKRSKKAWRDNLTPMWATTNMAALYLGVAPWAGLQKMHWQQFLSKADLPVLGGARRLTRERCTKIAVCQDRKMGRPCTGWNIYWVARKIQTLDHLVVGAATGEWVPVQEDAGKKTWFWAKAEDAAEMGDPGGAPAPKASDRQVDGDPDGEDHRALDRTCRYGQERAFEVRPPVDHNARIAVLPRQPTATTATPAAAVAANLTGPAYVEQMIIPGIQAVGGARLEVAAANMRAFTDEVRAQAEQEATTRAEIIGRPGAYTAVVGEPVRDEATDRDGRFGWVLPVNGRDQMILMPGVDLSHLQGMTAGAPCLLVNGNAWWWSTAIGSAVPLPERNPA